MDPVLGRAAFRLATFVTLTAGGLLLAVPRGTAEFTISLFTFLVGLAFMATVALVVRRLAR